MRAKLAEARADRDRLARQVQRSSLDRADLLAATPGGGAQTLKGGDLAEALANAERAGTELVAKLADLEQGLRLLELEWQRARQDAEKEMEQVALGTLAEATAQVEAERDALENKLQAENARWAKEKERFDSALRWARE